MFGHGFYYHGIIRKYVILFGNMFNDLRVNRFNSAGEVEQIMEIPISYGPKERYLIRLREDPSLDKKVAVQLPRLSFEISSINYAPSRTTNKLIKNVGIGEDGNSLRTQYTPVPYDIDFTLYGMFATNEDAVQVTEQILPFFRPEWTHSVKLIPQTGQFYDIPTVLNNMTLSDTYDSTFDQRREIVYTWNFTMKGYMFGPVSNRGVIKRTEINLGTEVDPTIATEKQIVLTPGLLANGQPTTNSAASIASSQIDANTNWGFAFDSEDFFTGTQ